MCDIDSGDYERALVWSEQRILKARKAHRCQACGARIEPGDSYWRRFVATSYSADDEPCCDACWAIAEKFGKEHRMTPCPSSLLEHVEECGWTTEAAQIRQRWVKASGVTP